MPCHEHNLRHIYFQTSKQLDKYDQMTKNHHVALCCSNVSAEGIASDIGTWEQNPMLNKIYIQHHKGSCDAYSNAPDQVVIKIELKPVVLWKYIDGQPARDFLNFEQKTAERHFYFDQYPNN